MSPILEKCATAMQIVLMTRHLPVHRLERKRKVEENRLMGDRALTQGERLYESLSPLW